MEPQGRKRSILRDLALIYIAFAHSTDQDLSAPEVDAISNLLRFRQTEATEETVLSAIKHALEDYTEERAQDAVDQAVRRVRDEIEPERRQAIVDDLIEIAMADDRFLCQEGTFIGQLARAWEVHFVPEEAESPWTVLTSNGNRGGWTCIHDLALVYLHVAHGTDGELQDQELDAIANKLAEWIPDADESHVLRVVREAMSAYVQGPDERLFDQSVSTLKTFVPGHQRAAILADLHHVARADGSVSSGEQEIIERLARAWSVELNEQES